MASTGISRKALNDGTSEAKSAVIQTIYKTRGRLDQGNRGKIKLLNPKPDMAAPEIDEISIPEFPK